MGRSFIRPFDVLPAVVRQNLFHVTRYLSVLSGEISVHRVADIHHVVGIAGRLFTSEVKGQGHREAGMSTRR